jgi:hypothetical protein
MATPQLPTIKRQEPRATELAARLLDTHASSEGVAELTSKTEDASG